MLRSKDYDLIAGANKTLILCLAYPGFGKDDLECTMEGINLRIKSVTSAPSGEYIWRGIPHEVNELVEIGKDKKIDMITMEHGILEILVSEVMPVPNSNRIAIQ